MLALGQPTRGRIITKKASPDQRVRKKTSHQVSAPAAIMVFSFGVSLFLVFETALSEKSGKKNKGF